MRTWRICLTIGIGQLICTLPVAAEETAPSQKKVVTADYGPAFEQLVKLGLPDAAGSTYIKASITFPEDRSHQDYSYSQYELENRLGNAWLQPQTDDERKTRSVIWKGSTVIETREKPKPNLLARVFARPRKNKGSIPIATFEDVSVEKELKTILKKINQLGERSLFDESTWSYSHSEANFCAKLLIIACHMHRSGNATEGNALADRILKSAPDPERVIDTIISQLADQSYEQALNTFFETRDWSAFLKDLGQITKTYSRGWKSSPGIAILTRKVRERITGSLPSIQPFREVPLNDKALSALDSLLESEEDITASAPNLWIIDPKGELNRRSRYSQGTWPEWVLEIAETGIDAIPTLIAACNDTCLIPQRLIKSRTRHISEPDDEDIYDALERPTTRSEVAQQLLISGLPRSADDDLHSLSLSELQEFAFNWWQENKNASREEISTDLLKGEYYNGESEIAFNILLESESKNHDLLLQEHLLDPERIGQRIQLASQYFTHRKGKAKSFFETYEKTLKESIIEGEGDLKTYERVLGSFKVLVDELSSEKVIESIRSGEIEFSNGLDQLSTTLSDGDVVGKIPSILLFAYERKDGVEQIKILNSLFYAINRKKSTLTSDEERKAFTLRITDSLLKNKDKWSKLLTRSESISLNAQDLEQIQLTPPTPSHFSAIILETIYIGEDEWNWRQLVAATSEEEAWSYILTRAKERLANDSIPPFPSPDDISPARKEEIKKSLMTLSATEILTFKESLPFTEKLAWQTITQELPSIAPGLLEASHMITGVDWSYSPSASQKMRSYTETALIGKSLNKDTIKPILDLLKNYSQTEDAPIILFYASRGLGGLTAYAYSDASSVRWEESLISDDFEVLASHENQSLQSFIGSNVLTEGDSPNVIGTLFSPPIDAEKEQKAFSSAVEKTLTKFSQELAKPSQDKDSEFKIILTTHSSALLKANEDDE